MEHMVWGTWYARGMGAWPTSPRDLPDDMPCSAFTRFPLQVEVMEVDSRQLFLLTGDAQAVVVYLPWSEFMPLPQQLAAALRSE